MPTRPARGISVVIANWNGGEYIARCLDALQSQSRIPDEVVVVDNGSTDGSPSLIRKEYPHVRLLTRPRNEGFCVGYNRAIRASRFPSVLILNSDVYLDPDFIERAEIELARDPEIGWISALIRLDNEKEKLDHKGQVLLKRMALANRKDLADGDNVFAGSGAAIFCRREMLDDVAIEGEVYDEDFFAYIEDLDLAWRAQHRGWRCVYRSDVSAQHIGSASQGRRVRVLDKSPEFLVHIIKNRYLTLIKNATPGVLVRFLPYVIAGEMALWGALLLRRPSLVRVFPLAISRTRRLIPSVLRKRRHVMRRRLVSDQHIIGLSRGL